jgi:hypothetical protein
MKTQLLAMVSTAAILCLAATSMAGNVASAAKKGLSIATARVTSAGAIDSFGGKGTTGAIAAVHLGGLYTVAFTGKYPSDIATNKVIVQATSEEGVYGVANAHVATATPTEIDVDVATFKTDGSDTPSLDNFFVTVFVGQ